MALYINGRPVHPIVQFLVTALVVAALVGLGLLLLPLIGGILVVLLVVFAGFLLYGCYWRWKHGDPLDELRRRMAQQMRAAEDAEDRAAEGETEEPRTSGLRPGERARTGVRRTTVVEDAVVVEEIKRRTDK